MPLIPAVRFAAALALLTTISACGGGGGGGGEDRAATAAPVVRSFAANPTSVLPGTAATLSWDAANVTSVRIEPGLGERAAQGSATVRPLLTTTYTLTATNSAGTRSASAQVTVTVLPAARVDSFTANPAAVAEGGSSELQWTTSDATLVSIDNGVGPVPADGSLTLSPATTTTYRLTATGLGGSDSREVTVTVLPPPAITSFGLSLASVQAGEPATLSWATRETTEVRIEPGLGAQPASGSLSVSPTATTTYRLTATGPGGVRTAEATLKVVSYDWTELSAALDSYLGSGEGQVDGYIFALEIRGRTVFERAGGNLRKGMRIPIASASKAPSAAAILALADQGLLDLDAPVSTYIGSAISWPLDKATITTRMLLNHSSGLPFGSACLEDDTTTLQACAQEIANLPLNFPPGAAFFYSGAGYQLAGFVAQQAAGIPWTQLFQQRIGTPLGLAGFSYVGNDNPRIGGGALSDTSDYLRITRMFLDGGRAGDATVLSEQSAASVTGSQIGARPVLFKPVAPDSGLDGYSNGWWISAADAHPGSAGPELSDPGLFGATPWMDFDKDYSAALWMVEGTDTGVDMWRAIRPLILEQIDQ
ncbi:serine hydrolase domain-containing protein [Solimonas fluminis]|nr:serine hydrolase domain-containing protein [Solimonas fluminis]